MEYFNIFYTCPNIEELAWYFVYTPTLKKYFYLSLYFTINFNFLCVHFCENSHVIKYAFLSVKIQKREEQVLAERRLMSVISER